MLSCYFKARFLLNCLINRNRAHKHTDHDFVLSKCLYRLFTNIQTLYDHLHRFLGTLHCPLYVQRIHPFVRNEDCCDVSIYQAPIVYFLGKCTSFVLPQMSPVYLPSIIALHNASGKSLSVIDVHRIEQTKGNIWSDCTWPIVATVFFNYAWDDVIMTIIECATITVQTV